MHTRACSHTYMRAHTNLYLLIGERFLRPRGGKEGPQNVTCSHRQRLDTLSLGSSGQSVRQPLDHWAITGLGQRFVLEFGQSGAKISFFFSFSTVTLHSPVSPKLEGRRYSNATFVLGSDVINWPFSLQNLSPSPGGSSSCRVVVP